MFTPVKPWVRVLLFLGALAAVSAAPDGDAEDFVRRGNQAFAQGKYDQAASLYQQAEEYATDPGLVAFNKAAALYRRGQVAEAESHYWLCLGDAGPDIEEHLRRRPARDLSGRLRQRAGPRLAPVLYNLGNCLLLRSEGKDADLLEQAVILFDHCHRLEWGQQPFQADVRHNWELAKELLRLHPRPPRRDKTNPENEGSQPPRPNRENTGTESSEPGAEEKTSRGTQPDPDHKVGPGDQTHETKETTPGKGNLAPLPDSDRLRAMTPAEAASYLRQAVQRILGERHAYQEQATRRSSPHVRDW